ncbi:MAG: Ig-like domain-containing protein [Methanococcaceae archaeon]
MNSAKIKNITLFLVLLFLSGCANQLPPGGGDIDRIPPEIISSYPKDGTTNFSDNYFELEFSEYVDKRTVKDAVFISPAINGNLEFDWSGRTVRVYFPEKLKDSVTYVVTIGTDVVDLNNRNRMAQSLVFSFSTGSAIDKRIVTGKVFADKPSGLMIFAYNTGRTQLNPLKNKPDYISQTGSDGSYKLAGLSAGTYRIFAVKDEYRDLLFQPEQDQIGFPSSDIKLKETDSLYTGMDFYLTSIDTSAPRLLSAVMTDKNHVLATFSEPLDSTLITPHNFFLYDSTEGKKSSFVYAFKGNSKPNEAVLVIKDALNEKNTVYFFADTVRDKAGNRYLKDFAALVQTTRPDTSKPDFIKTIPANNSRELDYQNPEFAFYLNDGIEVNNVAKALTFKDTLGQNVPFKVNKIDDASFTLTVPQLTAKTNYVIRINMKLLPDAAGNRRDSVYKFVYQTITGLEFTGVNGTVFNSAGKNLIILLKSSDGKNSYQQPVRGGKFDFTRIIPGKYILWAFNDADSNGVFTSGSLEPFKFSETFVYAPDTLELRARWTQSDVRFDYYKK